MFNIFSSFSGLTELPIKTYSVTCPLDRLKPGVDNIHFDVHLSPALCQSTAKVARCLFLKHAKVKKILDDEKTLSLVREKDQFKCLCRDVLYVAANTAKSDSEIQIDLLAQIAIAKTLSHQIQNQFKTFIEDFNRVARKYEISSSKGLNRYIQIKEKLSEIQQNKKSILLNVGLELFRYFIEVQREDIKEWRESILGPETNLPDDVFLNPILHVENPFEDLFMLDEYILMGHRFEDPDNYENILILIRNVLRKIFLKIFVADSSLSEKTNRKAKIGELPYEKAGSGERNTRYDQVDIWLKHVDNIDLLFNAFKSREQYKILKRQLGAKNEIDTLKKLARSQRKLLNFIYKKFEKAGLNRRITACYEMKSIYLEYCPPLVPHQVLQFLVKPNQRKDIADQLDRLKGFYGKSFPLAPLKKKVKHLSKITPKEKKKYLIRFLKSFARYHRDFQNFLMLREAMDQVNLVLEKEMIDLSRENRILYEYVLKDEQLPEEKPIINHVILKADVRDSTHITLKMKERGLNPASFFNLNFFVPITSILFEYSAEKVFIEGDAIILAISEHEDTPKERYCVARACGLAVQILKIVNQYNIKSRKHKLPILELGIGISFSNASPTFLFDESKRIMISPAINSADRSARCSKPLHQNFLNQKRPFTLYIFQKTSKEGSVMPDEDRFIRYNVNGIELNKGGFEKLEKEIDLESFECSIPDLQKKKIKVHTGKFPTLTGNYQRIILREGRIPEVSPEDFRVIRLTGQTYYEVCTHPILIEYIENLTS